MASPHTAARSRTSIRAPATSTVGATRIVAASIVTAMFVTQAARKPGGQVSLGQKAGAHHPPPRCGFATTPPQPAGDVWPVTEGLAFPTARGRGGQAPLACMVGAPHPPPGCSRTTALPLATGSAWPVDHRVETSPSSVPHADASSAHRRGCAAAHGAAGVDGIHPIGPVGGARHVIDPSANRAAADPEVVLARAFHVPSVLHGPIRGERAAAEPRARGDAQMTEASDADTGSAVHAAVNAVLGAHEVNVVTHAIQVVAAGGDEQSRAPSTPVPRESTARREAAVL